MDNMDHSFLAQDGTRIHYLDTGEGKPLIFPHGYGSCAEDNRELFRMFPSGYRCISFDQRGYGASPLTESAGLRQSARDMHDLIEALCLDQVTVVGYSMGASVLFAYVEQYGCAYLEKAVIGDMTPKIVNDEAWKLGLYQGWFTGEDARLDSSVLSPKETEARSYYFLEQLFLKHTPEEQRHYIDPITSPAEYEAFKKRMDAVKGMFSYSEEQVRANRYYMKSMAESDFRDTLEKITIPALLVYPDPGSLYCEAVGRYVEARLPDTRFLKIEDATHLLTPEQLGRYIQTICAFVSGVW